MGKDDTQQLAATVGHGTENWGDNGLELSPQEKQNGLVGHLGIENPVTIQPKLWVVIDGEKEPREPEYPAPKVPDYWIPGQGSITPFPHSLIHIWFQREAKFESVSTVDQSNKYIVDFRKGALQGSIPYSEDNGWPAQSMVIDNAEAEQGDGAAGANRAQQDNNPI